MRLLIAEDEKDLNQVITKTLQKNHYSVDSCLDGQEALDCLDMAEYDAIILDIMMPRVSGLEVLKKLRSAGNKTPRSSAYRKGQRPGQGCRPGYRSR